LLGVLGDEVARLDPILKLFVRVTSSPNPLGAVFKRMMRIGTLTLPSEESSATLPSELTVCAPFTIEAPLKEKTPADLEAAPAGAFHASSATRVIPLLKYQNLSGAAVAVCLISLFTSVAPRA
jgi:hypothetical protein